MSIEQKIAQLLEESKKLQEEASFKQKGDEGKSTKVTDRAATGESSYLGKSTSKENEDAKIAADAENEEIENATKDASIGGKGEESHIARMKMNVKEDVDALVNGEDLSEEFKAKAATIFEAAVVTRVKQEVARLEEEFDARLDEEVEAIKEGLIEKVDGYLNYVVEQWMTDNELALEHGMKNDILESFVSGMKGLFEQHYIEVPEEKFDVLGEMQEHIETVERTLDEQVAINVELNKQLNSMMRENAVDEFSSDMADTDAEKFRGLAEELAYEDSQSFKLKLQTIKENYFGKKPMPNVKSVVTDTPVALTEDTKKVVTHSPQMQQYLRALGSTK